MLPPKFETLDEVFFYVAERLNEQGRPSIGPNPAYDGSKFSREVICRYRGPDGLKCAAGHLFDDPTDLDDLEGTSLTKLYHVYMKAVPACPRAFDLISALQSAHDRAATTDSGEQVSALKWKERWSLNMLSIAREFKFDADRLRTILPPKVNENAEA